jgi:hypothetical protein
MINDHIILQSHLGVDHFKKHFIVLLIQKRKITPHLYSKNQLANKA